VTDLNVLESLYFAALEKPAAERAAFLDAACAGDADLRARVDRLLAALPRIGSFLRASPAAADRPAAAAAVDDNAGGVERTARQVLERPPASGTIDDPSGGAGTIISGRYKLLQQIGEGGMGTVWMAEQTEPIKRRVAVKLIRVERGQSKTILSRFEAERQAIALMDHPHIARLLDAGEAPPAHPGGATRPFFVMELVKGLPLTDFCDTQKLGMPERLRLFMQVCAAVQHAHQKGVIHRDLKPSNVLVESHDGKPVPKIIDFGLAKATGLQLSEHTLFTAFGTVMGTPLYMAPEQASASALDVDTRTDIYALGIILYELLTGTTPITRETLKKAALDEMLKLIREQEVPTPSSRLSSANSAPSVAANRQMEPAKLGRFVRGELDWIVLKALAKERDRRYETANGFARDIERFLNHEPVTAGPPSARYRFRKFVRRNKGPILAATIVLLTLIGGIVGTAFGLVRAERRANGEHRANLAAHEREAETEAVLDFVEHKVFAAARPKRQAGGLGPDVTLRQALEAALPVVDTSFTQQPLTEARLRMSLGNSFYYLGDARRCADQYQRAREIYQEHLGRDHPDALKAINNVANSYESLGRHADALRLREVVLAGRKASLGPDHHDTLKAEENLAESYSNHNRHREALGLREKVLAWRKVNLGPDDPKTLDSMDNVAISYASLGRSQDALELCEATLALRKARDGLTHPDTLVTMINLANCYDDVKRYGDALQLREETLPLLKTALPAGHPHILWTMHNLANSYTKVKRHADALNLHKETLALREAKLGLTHPDTLRSMGGLAKSLFELDRGAEAVRAIDECVRRSAGQVVHSKLLPDLFDLRLRYFVKAKDATGCSTTAELWETLNRTDAANLYRAAGCRAVTAAVLRATDTSPAAARKADAEADRAMATLRDAVAKGYTDIERMKNDKDLDALRARDDFKKMVTELEARSK
jgi:serine/threonine protein kinase